MRILAAAFLLAASLVLSTAAARAEARTVRIEPRPFYGATVTLEEGVRVFRPLPPHDRVIINPGSKTPLSLGIYESNNYNANYNYNYDEGFAAVPDFGGSNFGFIPGRGFLRGDRTGHKGRFRSLRGPQP
ncbi:MAG TPA: hypothetical protein VFR19_09035 [Hyphomicrobiaceae bacterium]|nr:hypothetical protein [Hyphomicrobiaceae bacterium]